MTAFTLGAWLVLAAVPAYAVVSCSVSTALGITTVTVDLSAGEDPTLSRTAGGVIQLDGANLPAPCASADVDTTDRLMVTTSTPDDSDESNDVALDLANGGFIGSDGNEVDIVLDLKDQGEVAADSLHIDGSSGADNIRFGASGINLNGDDDADVTQDADSFTVDGNGGDDMVSGLGGLGTGTAFVSAALTLNGGAGSDTLTGGDFAPTAPAVADTIAGGAGDDAIDGAGGGDASLTGGSGTDTVDGGGGNDALIDGDAGADRLNGGDGVDLLDDSGTTTTDQDRLDGGSGNDTLRGGAGDDTLIGGTGADDIDGEAGSDTIDEGTSSNGSDTFADGNRDATVDYSGRTAKITVTMRAEQDDGEAGENDDVQATISRVIGGSADDSLTGAGGSQTLEGGPGADTLSAGAGADMLEGSDGNDTLNGGDGADTADYSGAGLAVHVNLRTGTASGDGDDTLIGVENARGTGLADRLVGSGAANVLRGGGGPDRLSGLGGHDTLVGGVGDDTLRGGAGNDVLKGGPGTDVCRGGPGMDTTRGCEA